MRLRNLALFVVSMAACAEPDDARPASFTYLHAAIIEPSCATIGCHSASTAAGPELDDPDDPYDGPLDLSDPDEACDQLANRPFTLLIQGQGADDDYPRMPPDIPLPDPDIRLLLAWENAGNPCD